MGRAVPRTQSRESKMRNEMNAHVDALRKKCMVLLLLLVVGVAGVTFLVINRVYTVVTELRIGAPNVFGEDK